MRWSKPRGGSFTRHLVDLYQIARQQSMQTTANADGRVESLAATGKLPSVEMYAGRRKCSCWVARHVCTEGHPQLMHLACCLLDPLDSPATEARQHRPCPLLSSPSLAKSSHP